MKLTIKIAFLTIIFSLAAICHAGFIPFEPGASLETVPVLDIVESKSQLDLHFQTPGVLAKTIDTEEGPFSLLSIAEAGRTGTPGHPWMPFKGVTIEVPPGAEISVQCSGTEQELPGTYTVMPMQPPEFDCGERGQKPVFEYNPEIYNDGKPVPGQRVKIGSDGFIRNRRVVFLEIYPLQYYPNTGRITATPDLTVTVSWEGQASTLKQGQASSSISSSKQGQAWQKLQTNRLQSDAFDNLVNRIVSNKLHTNPNRLLSNITGTKRTDNRDGADYLIIAADQFADELAPLIEWKTIKGYSVRLATLSEVGGTTSSAIQAYLQNAFDTWTPAPTYVLLVGDVNQTPSTTVSPDAYGDAFPSDLPYSCLAGSDYFPDVFLGRFCVATETECANVVNKVMGYDRNPEVADWYQNSLVAAYFQDEYSPSCEADRWFFETAMHVYDFLGNSLGMNTSTALCTSASGCTNYYYRSDGYPHRPSGPSQVPQAYVDMITAPYQARNNIYDAINGGVSIVQHRDHGGETGWGDPPFSVSNVNSLENGSRLPVVFSLNCLTGAMDYSSDSFAEAFQKHPNGGAVGIVAATRVSYSGYNDLLCHGIYTGMFPEYDTTHSGNIYDNSIRPCEALNYGKYYMSTYEGTGSSSKYTYRLFHWFGDPEMMIRMSMPVPPTVDLPAAIPAGSTHVTLPVEEDYAMVGISQEGLLLGRGVAMGGVAEIPLSAPVQAGIDVTVVVTGFNLLPLETNVLSTAPDCGIVEFETTAVNCNGEFGVTVMDFDLNLNPTTLDTMTATVFSDSDPAGITVLCTETDVDLGIFTGTFITGAGGLAVSHGDQVTLQYNDSDCQGSPQTVTSYVFADCVGPAMGNLQIAPGAETILVSFGTDEASLPRVMYGTSYPPAQVVEGMEYGQNHILELSGLEQCTEYYLVVIAEDEAGNETVNDNGGAGFQVMTHQEVVILDANMSINPQWETQGQWAWGQPTGQGGDHGQPDPTTGYTGSFVYGYNLSGDYPANMSSVEYLTSQSVDCGSAETVLLSFWGWVGVEKSEFDHIYIDVSNDGGSNWQLLYENPFNVSFDGGNWTYWEFDITALANGSSDVKVRWGMGPTDAGWQYCGWNLDDIQVTIAGECGSIPTPPPTPTVYPTNTPIPTNTPTMTPTQAPPTFTPTPTPTSPSQTGVRLELPKSMFTAGDLFYLNAIVTNNEGQALQGCPLFVIMDVYGLLYFGPSFTQDFNNYLALYSSFNTGDTIVSVLPEFVWPAGVGSANGVMFYGALTDPGMMQLLGGMDIKEFGWQ